MQGALTRQDRLTWLALPPSVGTTDCKDSGKVHIHNEMLEPISVAINMLQ